MVTNELSQLADALHYFPFGEVWLEERPSSLPADYFFTAKEFDSETGFYNFGARYLDPRFSKWMTADPALGKYLPGVGKAVAYQFPTLANSWRGHPDLPGLGGAFQSQNMAVYTYGHSNPATLIDRDGNQTATDVMRWAPAALPALPALEPLVTAGVAFCASPAGWLPCGAAAVGGVIVFGGVVIYNKWPSSTPALEPVGGVLNRRRSVRIHRDLQLRSHLARA
jgi:RHS repeat-associated protein